MLHDWIWSAPTEGLEEGIYNMSVDPCRHPPRSGSIFLSSVPTKRPTKAQPSIPERGSTHRAQPWWTGLKTRPFVCEFVQMLLLVVMGKGLRTAKQEQPASTGAFSQIPLIRLLIVSSFDLVSCTMKLIKHFLKRCFKA